MAQTDWQEMADRVRNWGRWGAEDQLGTLNFITPDRIARAAHSVRRGARFSMAIPVDAYGPQGAHGYRRNPIHMMSLDGGDENANRALSEWEAGGQQEQDITGLWETGPLRWNDDIIIMPLQAGTQWDGLAHVYYDGKLYNGFPASTVTSAGATRDGIDHVGRAGGIMGRGVLLDVARHLKVQRLEPGYVIGADLLDEVIDAQSVRIEEGDILVIRTGWWTHFLEHRDADAWLAESPGVSWKVAEWLHGHSIGAIAADNIAVEVITPEVENHFLLFHLLAIRDMGMSLGEIWDLETLSEDCAEDGIYEFFLTTAPLIVPGGIGSPINPVAIK
jgi:kynurenine formamidase